MTFQSFFCGLGLNDIDEWSAFSSSKVVPSIIQPRATGHKTQLKANACSTTNRVKIIEHGRTMKGPILELRISCLMPNQDPAYFPPAPSPTLTPPWALLKFFFISFCCHSFPPQHLLTRPLHSSPNHLYLVNIKEPLRASSCQALLSMLTVRQAMKGQKLTEENCFRERARFSGSSWVFSHPNRARWFNKSPL